MPCMPHDQKTRWTKEEVGRQHQGMDRPGVRQVPEGSGKQGKTTLAVKGLMMMMMTVFKFDVLIRTQSGVYDFLVFRGFCTDE